MTRKAARVARFLRIQTLQDDEERLQEVLGTLERSVREIRATGVNSGAADSSLFTEGVDDRDAEGEEQLRNSIKSNESNLREALSISRGMQKFGSTKKVGCIKMNLIILLASKYFNAYCVFSGSESGSSLL